MKIVSWNVNGIRSVYRKNFSAWLEKLNADIVCLQEVKAQEEQVAELFPKADLFSEPKYNSYFNLAQKRGYSGVACITKQKPLTIQNKLGLERFDSEGRMLALEYPDFTLINFYIPHGGRFKENLPYKLDAYGRIFKYIQKLKSKNIILAGDFNIAREEIDLARPKDNQNNTMFTQEERETLGKLIGLGFVDSFRKFVADGGHYTWWPYAVEARQRNLGWRIDYIFVSDALAPKLKGASILRETKGSDHCPIGIEF